MISPQNYDKLNSHQRKDLREEYVKDQKGKCAHCGGDLDRPPRSEVRSQKVTEKFYPPGFFRYLVHLHHNHVTGMTIGAVHAYCNAVLWEYHGE